MEPIIRLAREEDGPALAQLQARCPQTGDLVIVQRHIPDYFERLRVYDDWAVFVAEVEGKIVGSTGCSLRRGFINGRVGKIGYKFLLMVDPDYRRMGLANLLMTENEEHLKREGAEWVYSIIIDSNTPSIRTGARLGNRTVRALRAHNLLVYRKMRLANPPPSPIRADEWEEAARALNDHWRGWTLAPSFSAESLEAMYKNVPGYQSQPLWVSRSEDRIVACSGVWDMSRVVEVTVQKLPANLRALGVLLGGLGRVVNLPQVPKTGQSLKQWVVGPIAFKTPQQGADLLRHINNRALEAGIDQLIYLADSDDPLLGCMKGFLRASTPIRLNCKSFDPKLEIDDGRFYVPTVDL